MKYTTKYTIAQCSTLAIACQCRGVEVVYQRICVILILPQERIRQNDIISNLGGGM